ncbi:PREDICTED: amyloid beta A4 precursor protein-binding family A member 1-like [Galeopterus variegatus]|uniref:Amyloid beta A4 precursor protein-binding family A member 1-like n=1 Tax=Galeopterus variegatus TaxID=482537 RepID=A0ABM0QAH2_GALVR|nr:PREDICTED: amyloid beta A4 precursor protein-binding family A member 1-like [Galeopterus variegatus]
MNHLEGSAEVEVTDEAAGGEVNESVEADLEHPEVEQEQQRQPQQQQQHQRAADPAGGGEAGQRYSKEKRDAISLAIKDIKEAIEEVKTRTIRSPYTPDEPKEPIWVMRQDISPTRDCEDQRPVDGDSPSPGSSSPLGAESSSTPLHPSDPAEASTNKESRKSLASFPTYVEVPGPCDPEDLIDGIIFAANYLGSTQLLSDKTPSKNVRMMQAQEAVSRIKMAQKLAKSRKKAPEGESQPMTEVDLFISTQRIKVLNADTQETMMDHPLRTISYIADIGNIVVLMARRRMPRSNSQENVEASHPSQDGKRQYKMICHVFESEDAQLIAQSIGQAFSVAYQEFLRANGINPEDLSQKEYSDLLNTQDMYNDDLIHFSKSENCKDVGTLLQLPFRPGQLGRSPGEQGGPGEEGRRGRAQLIAQSIGQAFSVAYQEFLRANGINPEDLSQKEYSDLLNTQDMYNDDLIHFSKSENCKDVGTLLQLPFRPGQLGRSPGEQGGPGEEGRRGRVQHWQDAVRLISGPSFRGPCCEMPL